MRPVVLIALAVVVAGGSCGMAWNKHRGDLKASDVAQAEAALAEAQTNLSLARELPELPALDESWRKLDFIASACGLTLSRGGAEDAGTPPPASSWPGVLTGKAAAVAACSSILIDEVPINPIAIAMAAGSPTTITLSFYLLGKS